MFTLAAILLLFERIASTCQIGCLKCNPLNQCLYCDISKGYYLSQMNCQASTIKNCDVLTEKGSCLQCSIGYYLDPATNNCIQVPISRMIDFCDIYDYQLKCVYCRNMFYLSNNVCIFTQNVVPNCLYYSADGVCAKCVKNYTFSGDLLTCKQTILPKRCRSLTYLQCLACKPEFIFNPNYFASKYDNVTYVQMKSINRQLWTDFGDLNVCSPIQVSNCLNAYNSTFCLKCQDGYFSIAGNCYVQPLASIYQCMVYKDEDTCERCNQGFYLKTIDLCVPVQPMENCVSYDGTAIVTRCIECDKDFFLLSNTTCRRRIVSLKITNCAKLAIDQDNCQICNESFEVTTDRMKCLPNTNFCQAYALSNVNSMRLVCVLCKPGYYLRDQTCVQLSILNCLQSQVNVESCVVCMNGYYLWNGYCLQHTAIPNCAIFDPIIPNGCLSCDPGFLSWKLTTVCVKHKTIIGCEAYSPDGLSCTRCSSGFYLTTQGVCFLIPAMVNGCTRYTANGCQQCSNGTFMVKGVCQRIPDFLTNSCSRINDNLSLIWSGNNTQKSMCEVCADNSFAITPNIFDSICIKNSDLVLIPNFFPITGCYRYGVNLSGYIICMECLPGLYANKYLSPGNYSVIRCGPCNLTENVVIPDDLFGTVNICMPTGTAPWNVFAGCALAPRSTAVAYANGGQYVSDFSCGSSASGFGFVFTSPQLVPFTIDILRQGQAVIQETSHGYTLNDTIFSPIAFNYRGIQGAVMPTTSLMLTVDCDVYWNSTVSGTRGIAPVAPAVWTGIVVNRTYCLRCAFGRSQIVWLNPSSQSYTNCSAMPTGYCFSGVVLGGLPSFLNAAFSCHSCGPMGLILRFPTLYMQYGGNGPAGTPPDNNNWYQFAEPNAAGTTGFTCEPQQAVLLLASQTMGGAGAAGPQLLPGCGAFGVITPVSSNVAASPISVCLACINGYYPIYNPTAAANYLPIWAIQSCNTISNCDISVQNATFNGCTRCLNSLSGGSSVFRAFTDWSLTGCERSITPFCFILLSPISSLILNNCTVCMTGYFLNTDGFCDTLTLANAASTASFSAAFYYSFYKSSLAPQTTNVAGSDKVAIRIHYLLQYFSRQFGITGCQANYSLVPSPFGLSVCFRSLYLSSSYRMGTVSRFILNCVQYFANTDTYRCSKCSETYMPTSDGSVCVQSIFGCQLAFSAPSSNICHTCQTGYLNVYGQCLNQQINNCNAYVNTQTSANSKTLQCAACQNGYWLNNNQTICTQGNITNCNTYQIGNGSICLNCTIGYVAYLFQNASKCLPIDPKTKCVQLASGTGNFNCLSCLQTPTEVWGVKPFRQTVMSADTPVSLCQSFQTVTNCVGYDQNNTNAQNNTLLCTQCSTFYYLNKDNQTCIPRSILSPHCLQYHKTKDSCKTCVKGAFVSKRTKRCVAFPTGLVGCTVYQDLTTCLQCKAPMFLELNRCIRSTTILPNCYYYSGDSFCGACEQGYFLAGGTVCIQNIAQNCLDMQDQRTCLSCPQGYGLISNNVTTDCVPTNLPNCLNSTLSAPFACLQCIQGYFLRSDGFCMLQTYEIANCLFYGNQSVCTQCVPGAVLSIDNTTCSLDYKNLVDPNCMNNVLLNDSYCSECEFGYQFNDGQCVESPVDLMNRGCLIFDPQNIKNCWMCKSDYYQDKNGFCNYIGTSEALQTMVETSHFSLSNACIYAFILLIIINK